MNIQDLNQYLPTISIIAGGIILSIIIQFFIIKKLRNLSAATIFREDDRIVKSISIFPLLIILLFTAYFAEKTLDLTYSITQTIQDILLFAGLVIVTILSSRLIAVISSIYLEKTSGNSSASLFTNVIRILIYIIGGLIISQSFGIDITAALTALGVGGLAVALALQDTLANLFSGFYIIAARKIKRGDYVKLDSGEEGYVEDITWRNTTIKLLSNNITIVPNIKLASAIITNYNLPITELAVLVDLGVSYDSDLDVVEKLTIETANEIMQNVEGGVKNFQCFVRFNEFGDSSINFTVIMRGKTFADQFLIKHEFIKQIHKKFSENKIEIPYPKRDVYVKKEN